MEINGIRIALFIVDVFVALTAVGGGIARVAGLENERFPIEMLSGTLFGSYTIPGLILAALKSPTSFSGGKRDWRGLVGFARKRYPYHRRPSKGLRRATTTPPASTSLQIGQP